MDEISQKREVRGTAKYVMVGGSGSGVAGTIFAMIVAAVIVGYLGGPIAWMIVGLFLFVFLLLLWRAKRQDDIDRKTAAILERIKK